MLTEVPRCAATRVLAPIIGKLASVTYAEPVVCCLDQREGQMIQTGGATRRRSLPPRPVPWRSLEVPTNSIVAAGDKPILSYTNFPSSDMFRTAGPSTISASVQGLSAIGLGCANRAGRVRNALEAFLDQLLRIAFQLCQNWPRRSENRERELVL